MTIKSRLPGQLDDERAMRPFLDRLDRNHVKIGEIEDLAASPTNTELATAINAIIEIMRSK
jgi:hypothetical protein